MMVVEKIELYLQKTLRRGKKAGMKLGAQKEREKKTKLVIRRSRNTSVPLAFPPKKWTRLSPSNDKTVTKGV